MYSMFSRNQKISFTEPNLGDSRGSGLTRVPVLGGLLTPLDLDKTVNLLLDMVRGGRGGTTGYVCIANVHTTTLAVHEDNFRAALNGATAVVADGMPVVWRVRAAGYPHVGRVYGVDLIEATCRAGVQVELRHGFLGGRPGLSETMVASLRARHPDLRVAGTWDPGVIAMGETAPRHLLDAINDASPDVLWVGLGAPKQEVWMAQHRSYLRAPVLVGVGQAFDILAGRTTRPPAWMGRHGLEWLYRLTHEPRRLWKRYIVYNSLFLWYLVREWRDSGPNQGPA
jgi:N-acetylglucosaminyldiphosphoundecaprenol N-acetyl-beta-D-mannosaminyltransferase